MLVRILEGNETPYYIQNNPEIYIRTADTSHIVKLASAEAQRLLYSKRLEAMDYQKQNILLSERVYIAFIRKSQRELDLMVASEKDNYKRNHPDDTAMTNFRSRFYTGKLGKPDADCTILIQPYYPVKAILDLKNLYDYIGEMRVETRAIHPFPNIFESNQTIPEGAIFSYVNNELGGVECQQIYGKGFIYHKKQLDVMYGNEYCVFLNHLGEMLYQVLEFGRRLYKKTGYQGSINGLIQLEGVENKLLYHINPTYSGDYFSGLARRGFLDTYTWDINLNTYQLSAKDEFLNYYHETINRIYWDIGYKERITKHAILTFMSANNWIIE